MKKHTHSGTFAASVDSIDDANMLFQLETAGIYMMLLFVSFSMRDGSIFFSYARQSTHTQIHF